jgi:hypothetical protein
LDFVRTVFVYRWADIFVPAASAARQQERTSTSQASALAPLGRGPIIVGDPVRLADQLEAWMDDTGIDGFNLAFAVAHESMRDGMELVVPELQRHGRYRHAYVDGTLREQLLGAGPRLADNHRGRQVRIDPPHLKQVHAASKPVTTGRSVGASLRHPWKPAKPAQRIGCVTIEGADSLSARGAAAGVSRQIREICLIRHCVSNAFSESAGSCG